MNADDMRRVFTAVFDPIHMIVRDDSHAHHGHGGTLHTENTHFSVTIVSAVFRNMPLVTRHRLVMASLKEAFSHTLHAVAITAKSPEEWGG
jgi:BolA protein